MNVVVLAGRPTKDPVTRYSQSGVAVTRYTLAVDREYAKDGQQSADFISCVALGKNGEFAEKYIRKGMKIIVEGRIQTGSYKDENDKNVYFTEVNVEKHEFCEKKSGDNQARDDASAGFINIPDGIEEELPFN